MGEYVLDEVMISSENIGRRVTDLAGEIRQQFAGRELIVAGVLKGAAIFLSDLVRAIGDSVDVRMDFLAVSSYGSGSTSSGAVKIVKDLDTLVEGRNVILVEDIMDTGLTLAYLREMLEARDPACLKTCVLLEKPERKIVDSPIEYKGFTIPDKFVVGYGLDYAGRWRHLPDIWCVTESAG